MGTLCILYSDKKSCEGATVPQSELEFLNSNKSFLESFRHDGKFGWPCLWNGSAPLRNIETHRCIDPNCNHGTLRGNAASISCEYTLICSWIYIVSLSLVAAEALKKTGDDSFELEDSDSSDEGQSDGAAEGWLIGATA